MIWPKVYEVPIREAPVLTLCFSSTGDGKYSADKTIYNYSTDFNMTVQEFNMLTESKAKITLRKGKNIMENSISKPIFYLEELQTKYDGTCYMITVEYEKQHIDAINTQWNLRMYMNSSEKLSTKIYIYFTSKENAYGILQRAWKDGTFWNVEFDQPYLGKYISLRPLKTINKPTSKSPCRNEYFWKCIERNFLPKNFEDCPKFCAPYSFPSNGTQLCQTFQEWYCIKHKMYNLISTVTMNGECPKKSCQLLEYEGTQVLKYLMSNTGLFMNSDHDNVFNPSEFLNLWYWFESPQNVLVHEEYLIYDGWSTLGYIGGILGMTIGFSFTNLVAGFTGLIKKLLHKTK